MNKSDIRFEYTRGKGPGGRHRNSTDSCVTATHIPTGITVRVDGRKQGKNKKKAIHLLEQRIQQEKDGVKAILHSDDWITITIERNKQIGIDAINKLFR